MIIIKNIPSLREIIDNKENLTCLTSNNGDTSKLNIYLKDVANNIARLENDKSFWYEKFYSILSDFTFMLDEITYASSVIPCGLIIPYFGFVYDMQNENKILTRINSVAYRGAKISVNMDNVDMNPIEFINHLVKLLWHQSFNLGMYCLNMSVGHKNTLDFITAKQNVDYIKNFIFCIHISDEFMDSIINKTSIENIQMFDKLAEAIHDVGEPTIVFSDRINEANTIPQNGRLQTISSCGEMALFDNEGFVEGSINLSKMIDNGTINYNKLSDVTRTAVRLLDDVIETSYYENSRIEEATKATRKIGIGVTGFADMLIQLNIHYNSRKALSTAEGIMQFINNEAHKASEELAKERGAFPLYVSNKFLPNPIRNATVTAISHAGFLPIATKCCMGIEPLFSTRTTRFTKNRIGKKDKLTYEYPHKQKNKNVIKTAYSISPKWHIKMQAAFQKHIDGGVSKTINLPKRATVENVKNMILLAYQLRCKGIAIYRKGCNCEPTTVFREEGENDKKIDYDWTINGNDLL